MEPDGQFWDNICTVLQEGGDGTLEVEKLIFRAVRIVQNEAYRQELNLREVEDDAG